jgi:hypothetical protein
VPELASDSGSSESIPEIPAKASGNWSPQRAEPGASPAPPPPEPEPSHARRSSSPPDSPDPQDPVVPDAPPAPVPRAPDLGPWLEASPELRTFSLYRDGNSLIRGVSLRMTLDDCPIFYMGPNKDALGKSFVVSSDKPAKLDAPGYAGLVRTHGSGERFAVVSRETCLNDDREAELAGAAYLPGGAGRTLAGIVLVLPAAGAAHFAISKRWDMSRVALAAAKDEPISPKFVAYRSSAAPNKDDWETVLGLGQIGVIKSCKNCLICDANGERIFILYKLSGDWFSMKCKAPISPYVGFGLAVAIISSAK